MGTIYRRCYQSFAFDQALGIVPDKQCFAWVVQVAVSTAREEEDVRKPNYWLVLLSSSCFSNIETTGGRTRIRTLDPLIKSQLLYQLSYAPNPGFQHR